MDLNKKNVKMLIFVIAVGILIFLGLQNMNIVFSFLGRILTVLTPMLIGLAFAFIFNVPLKFFEKKVFTRKDGTPRLGKATRPVSLLISVLLVIAIIAAVLLLIIPELINSIVTLVQNLPDTFINFQNWINQLSEEHPQVKEFFMNTSIDWNEIVNSFISTIQNISINFVSQALNILVGTVSLVVNIFLGFIFSVYFLLQKEQLFAQFKKLTYAFIPEKKADSIVYVFRLTGDTFSRSVAGSLIECTILGTITVTAMLIFNFPYAMMIGVIVGVMALIPMFGVTIGIVIGALLILTINPTQAIWFVVMMIIIQQIEGNLIYPRVAGSVMGLPALWVMASIIIGANLFGFVGMLVIVPIVSVIYTIMRQVVHVRLRKRKIPLSKIKTPKKLVTMPQKSSKAKTAGSIKNGKKSPVSPISKRITYSVKEHLPLKTKNKKK